MSETTIGRDTVIITGAGMSAGELATRLRKEGYAGRILMVGEEPYLPYHRPPLSKTYLSGTTDLESLYLKPQATYAKARVDFISRTRVERIERASKQVTLSDGRRLDYGKLVLAVGGRAKMLDAWRGKHGQWPCNLHAIRTIDDVARLHPQFVAGRSVVMVGGGYIGLEVAAVAINRGLRVTVLEALPRVLARVTSPEISMFYERVHREAGVDLRTGVEIQNLDFGPEGNVIRWVICADGERIPADLVILSIGMIPNTELAQAANLAIGNGIIVDEDTRTSDPDIFAIGDCSNHPNVATGRRVRLESVPNALDQARIAAATICGKQRPPTAVPWFWSDQYNLKLQIVGLSEGYDQIILRGSTYSRAFTAFYLKEGRIIAVDAVNRPREFMVAKTLVTDRVAIDPARLMDESVPLSILTPAPAPACVAGSQV